MDDTHQAGHGDSDIAIVGMACRFPGARTPEEFWQVVRDGIEAITPLGIDELRVRAVPDEHLTNPRYVRAAGRIADVECFDAAFFGIGPRDAAIMDPQHRHFLECAWEALEQAGHPPDRFTGAIGVYAGCGTNSYLINNLLTNPELVDAVGMFLLRHTGNHKDFLTTGTSYRLNLTGPSISVQTACSSSLVAIHLAVQGLATGECDLALAGGVTIQVPHGVGYLYREGEIQSPDGHCRAFDAESQGTVLTSGVGVVALRRLRDAIEDGDFIYAVIKSSAVNNDGNAKAGYLAVSENGLAAVIAEALAIADISVESIQYVETHGTGTPIGDSIEFAALTQAFRAHTSRTGYCRIGSHKPNIGHTDTAAGVAGVIKVAQALRHRQLPPLANFTGRINPLIKLDHSPFYISGNLAPWERAGSPRRAGVSALGVGGTNAHVILEEAPDVPASASAAPWQLLVLSAKSEAALDRLRTRLAEHLQRHLHLNLADVAYTLQVGRSDFRYRLVGVCRDTVDAATVLGLSHTDRVWTGIAPAREPSVVFVLPGRVTPVSSGESKLYETEPAYRREIERCLALLEPSTRSAVRRVLRLEEAGWSSDSAAPDSQAITSLAAFVTEYALARLWESWRIQPAIVVGAGTSLLAAACLTGMVSLADALALAEFWGGCGGRSRLNEPIPAQALSEFYARFAGLQVRDAATLCLSGATGRPLTPADIRDPNRWTGHLHRDEHSFRVLDALLQEGGRIAIIMGSDEALGRRFPDSTGLSDRILAALPDSGAVVSERQHLLATVGRAWLAGLPVDWAQLHNAGQRRRLPLPTYPFERQRHWIAPGHGATAAGRVTAERSPDIGCWFYAPAWRRSDLPSLPDSTVRRRWLVFVDTRGLGERIVERLRGAGQSVVTVRTGNAFARVADDAFIVNPEHATEYGQLMTALAEQNLLPDQVVHLWSLTPSRPMRGSAALSDRIQTLGFYSLVFLGQAVAGAQSAVPTRVTIVTDAVRQVDGEVIDHPQKATVLGPALLLRDQVEGVSCQTIDVLLPSSQGWTNPRARTRKALDQVADGVVLELLAQTAPPAIALRQGRRWVHDIERVELPATTTTGLRLRSRGVYLLTNGWEGIGHAMAVYLAEQWQARLVLVERLLLPPRDAWAHWLATHEADDAVSGDIRTVVELERRGAEVLMVAADLCKLGELRVLREAVLRHFGTLHGIIHLADSPRRSAGLEQERTPTDINLTHELASTALLDEVLGTLPLDFVLLCTENDAVPGPAGRAGAIAVGAFFDAIVANKRAFGGCFVVSAHWVTAQSDRLIHADGESVREPPASHPGMRPEEVGEALRRILAARQLPHVVVSPYDVRHLGKATAAPGHDGVRADPLRVARPQLASAFVEATEDIERTLVKIWEHLLGIEGIGIHDDFFDLGGNSIIAARLFSRIKQMIGADLGLAVLFQAPTIAQLADAVRAALANRDGETAALDGGKAWPCLVPIQPRGTRTPFFCVHGVFGNVIGFRELALYLGADQPFYGLQAYGLDGRHPLYTRIEHMAAHYLREIRQVQPAGPYLVGGYSGGGVIAFEMARQLRAAGEDVALLALIDALCPDPYTVDNLRWQVDTSLRAKLGRVLDDVRAGGLRFAAQRLLIKFAQRRLQTLDAASGDAKSLERDVSEEIRRAFLEGLAAYDLRPLDIPLTLLRAQTRFEVLSAPPDLGWGRYAAAGIEVRRVPGDHFTVVYEPNVKYTARALRAAIDHAVAAR